MSREAAGRFSGGGGSSHWNGDGGTAQGGAGAWREEGEIVTGCLGVVRIDRDLGYPFYRTGDGVDRGGGRGNVCSGLTRAGTRR